MPFNHSEYKAIVNIYKAHGIKGRQLGDLRRRIYNMTEMGKKAGEDFRKKVNQLNRPLEAKDSEAKRDPSNSADGSGADETIA
jgi:DNA-binding PadR family transcriptional regulator